MNIIYLYQSSLYDKVTTEAGLVFLMGVLSYQEVIQLSNNNFFKDFTLKRDVEYGPEITENRAVYMSFFSVGGRFVDIYYISFLKESSKNTSRCETGCNVMIKSQPRINTSINCSNRNQFGL